MKFIKKLFRKTYVVDINLLPNKYKTNNILTEEGLKKYEDEFNINILPVDLSPTNVRTGSKVTLTFEKV